MADLNDKQFSEATDQWCDRAEAARDNDSIGCRDWLVLVREGILLRRDWDRYNARAPQRRRLLRLLATAQSACYRCLVEHARGDCDVAGYAVAISSIVVEQLAEDDRYLAGLLDDHKLPTETVAFAIECFRDDLHWQGTMVALLEGREGIDFLGRVLLEEESLRREIDAWEDRPTTAAPPPRMADPSRTHRGRDDHGLTGHVVHGGTSSDVPMPLGKKADKAAARLSSQRLREVALRVHQAVLSKQVKAMLDQPRPTDWHGWYNAWQASSRLLKHLETGSTTECHKTKNSEISHGQIAAEAEVVSSNRKISDTSIRKLLKAEKYEKAKTDLEAYHALAQEQWLASLADLDEKERGVALEHAAQELGEVAAESLAFMEESSLGEAVRTVELMYDDVRLCRCAVRKYGTADTSQLERSLRRREKHLSAEMQERRLAWRMENRFGHRAVETLERFILFLLLLFCFLLVAETPLVRLERTYWPDHGMIVESIFAWLDLGICLVFLFEFFLKISMVNRKWLFFRRNWLTMLLPSIPFGFIALASHQYLNVVELGESVMLLRLLRLPRMVRWLRVARPVIRMFRLLGFALQASDRLVRQFSPLLNRNFVLFERATIASEEPPYRKALLALRERFNHRAAELLAWLPRESREALTEARLRDLMVVLSATEVGHVAPPGQLKTTAAREISLESVIARLLAATPAGVSDRIGRTLATSTVRWCRSFDVFAVRRLPLVRDLVAAGRLSSPYETTAQVANQLGVFLRHALDRVYWVADLYGTVTAPQLVDSLGDWMVKGTARPTRRFLMLGLSLLVVSYLASLLPIETLKSISQSLEKLVGAPLVILGLLCLIPLTLGIWFRQIAGEASEFYNRVAEAQYFAATKRLKQRLATRYRSVLQARVIEPENEFNRQNALQQNENELTFSVEQDAEIKEAIEQLWENYLEGAPFHYTDTKTTNQLLGNLVLISIRRTRLRYGRDRRKQLLRLDLANSRASFRGPHLWFHFISRSLIQQTAKLVVDYNTHTIPLRRAATARPSHIRRYAHWLARRQGKSVEDAELPQAVRERLSSLDSLNDTAVTITYDDSGIKPKRLVRRQGFQSNDFTAVHFLSADADLEDNIRARYGDQIAEMMRRDRRDNIRRTFRTYPLHHLPREKRTFNPFALYQQHFEGGRVLLLPLKIVFWSGIFLFRAARMICRFVCEVLNPKIGETGLLDKVDPYEVAVRKIHRMRKPIFLECLRMRADFDPEYLGIRLPGMPKTEHKVTRLPVEEDLALINANPRMRDSIRSLGAIRRRQVIEFRRWLERLNCGDQSLAALRAMTIAYTIDYRDARSRLEMVRLLERSFVRAVEDEGPLDQGYVGFFGRIMGLWTAFQYSSRFNRLFELPTFKHYQGEQQAACRRMICRRRGVLLKTVRSLTSPSMAGDPIDGPREGSLDDPVNVAKYILLDVAHDPDTWSRQLVVLRTIQTLSVLDLTTCCDLVAELGEYEKNGHETELGYSAKDVKFQK
ncbi:MAG: hypothetical protein JXM70_09620 [Pirellulales bacterium]|nr:hypothetical protein [Pirellulales bacterium]